MIAGIFPPACVLFTGCNGRSVISLEPKIGHEKRAQSAKKRRQQTGEIDNSSGLSRNLVAVAKTLYKILENGIAP